MNTPPTTYAIRVHGHLEEHWSTWLGEPDMTREKDGTTTITASNADQARLHGVLAGLRDIGAVITELRTTDGPPPTCRPVLERPLHTDRLTLRPATAVYADPTWPASGHRGLLPRQRHLLEPHGARRHAPRTARFRESLGLAAHDDAAGQ